MKRLIFFYFVIFSNWSSAQSIPDSCKFYISNIVTIECGKMFQLENEGWRIYSDCDLEDFHLQIFNRWGDIVFESKNIEEKWSPWITKQSDGVYIWQFTFVEKTDTDGDGKVEKSTITKRGHVTFLN